MGDPSTRLRVGRIIGVALVYAACSWTSSRLAIPPGYATAVWPPAGLALAAILLWGNRVAIGVGLGSFVAALALTRDAVFPAPELIWLPICLALLSVTQALVGALLVRRVVAPEFTFDSGRAVLALVGLGGPVSCLLGGLLGPLLMVLGGRIAAADYGFNVLTWWAGDSIGVLVATPLLLVWFSRPRAAWRRRRLPVTIPVLAGVVLVVALFTRASIFETERIQATFDEQSRALHFDLTRRTQGSLETIYSVAALIETHPSIGREDFARFVKRFHPRHPEIRAYEWIPWVADADRERVEQEAHRDGLPQFRIYELDERGETRPAARRDRYAPVLYVEPLAGNEPALGLDLGHHPGRKAALEASTRTDGAASEPIRLVQTQGWGTLAVAAVPELGNALGVVQIDELVELALPKKHRPLMWVEVFDVDAGQRLFADADFLAAHEGSSASASAGPRPRSFVRPRSYPMRFMDRTWELRVHPAPAFVSEARSLQAWALLAGGMLFTGFLGSVLFLLTGRTTQVERLVDERTAELRSSERSFRSLIERLPDGVLVHQEGRVVYANPSLLRLLEYPDLDALMGADAIETLVHPDYHDVAQARSDASAAGDPRAAPTELGLMRSDKAVVTAEGRSLAAPFGGKKSVVVAFRDITELKRVERLHDEFLSTVNHELRTPLTAIHGALGLLQADKDGSLGLDHPQMVDIARSNSDRLLLLVNDLLDLSQLESGAIKLSRTTVDAAALAQRVVSDLSAIADNAAVTLTTELPRGDQTRRAPPAVSGDEERLLQVLVNLVANAIKFAGAEARDPGRVIVRLVTTPARVRFEVEDNGPGIPAVHQERVFDRFCQLDASNTRKQGGTGLGLAIAREIIEQHDGEIGVRSTPGVGATFYFTLARADGPTP